jgi:predicted nucleic acid-binding protein
MYLFDTNVVSEIRLPDRANPNVVSWALSVPRSAQYISVVTLMELEIGALSIKRRDASQGNMLQNWIRSAVLPGFAGRVLAFDADASLHCAPLHVPNKRPERDAMIAATALAHGLTVVTRNKRDFAPMAVPVLNPWQSGSRV